MFTVRLINMKIIILVLIIGIGLWIIWSYLASNVEQLKYSVLEKKDKYEIRSYEKYIEAKVDINQVGTEALNQGFRVLANYIFGGNVGNNKVSMTAPVMSEEKITMTAPVLTQENSGVTSVVFSMPSKYRLEDLPKTTDKRITFIEIEPKKIAAYKFSWYYTTDRINEKKKEFIKILQDDKKIIKSEPIFAGYSGPGTIPFMARYEILVEIE